MHRDPLDDYEYRRYLSRARVPEQAGTLCGSLRAKEPQGDRAGAREPYVGHTRAGVARHVGASAP